MKPTIGGGSSRHFSSAAVRDPPARGRRDTKTRILAFKPLPVAIESIDRQGKPRSLGGKAGKLHAKLSRSIIRLQHEQRQILSYIEHVDKLTALTLVRQTPRKDEDGIDGC